MRPSIPIYVYYVATLALGLTLACVPRLDLAFSGLFYDPATQDFFLGDVLYPVAQVIQGVLRRVPWVVLALLIAGLVPGVKRFVPAWRNSAFFLLCIVLVPCILVNDGLKEPFGRARPAKVSVFGGELSFTPALVPSDQCEGNCSFVSGDAAGGFAFVTLGLLARRHRRLWIRLAIALGCAIGMVRIAEGRHFLSDVVFAGLFTVGSIHMLYWLLMAPTQRPEERSPLHRLLAAIVSYRGA